MSKKTELELLEARLTAIPGMSELLAREHAAIISEETASTDVAGLVRDVRKSANLSQTDLAGRVGVTQARISQIEHGDTIYGMSIVLLARLATACGKRLQVSFT